jgi:hypothetical protein
MRLIPVVVVVVPLVWACADTDAIAPKADAPIADAAIADRFIFTETWDAAVGGAPILQCQPFVGGGASVCMKSNGCFVWELVATDFSVPSEVGFTWRLSSSCVQTLNDVRFTFAPGVGIVSPTPGSTYTAPSGRSYATTAADSPYPGIAFVTGGDPLANGQFDDYTFRVSASQLTADTLQLALARTAGDGQNRICFKMDLDPSVACTFGQ